MSRIRLDPPAASLMQSIRGVGYHAKTAIADLIDNSISAGAENVWVKFRWAGRRSSVSIVDDGHGMSAEQLELAMTLGSRSPTADRKLSDLGRFGLGLKTASLSQCSRLTVGSHRHDTSVQTRTWDLKTVQDTNDWLVEDEVSTEEESILADLRLLPAGTMVIWTELDRLVGDVHLEEEDARLDFQRVAAEVEAHVAMTFHRFLEGSRPRLRIFFQGDDEEFRVKPWDPFCIDHRATQHLPEARRSVAGGAVSLKGFVLPHKDRFSPADYERMGGPEGWIAQQGFYVYRNERLLVAGSWLGLGSPRRWARDEQHKLARIQLDIPNSLDAAWQLDIKKSKALPPLELRDWLRRLATNVRVEAREVFVHRGAHAPAAAAAAFSAVWIPSGGPSPTYKINRDHPTIAALTESGSAQGKQLRQALHLLESTVPIHRIWLDVAEAPESPEPASSQMPEDAARSLLSDLYAKITRGGQVTGDVARRKLALIEPFNHFPHLIAALEE